MEVCEGTAAASEAASVCVIKDLYRDLAQPQNNSDVIFGGTWKTRGRSSHIGVGCIIELYTGLAIDHCPTFGLDIAQDTRLRMKAMAETGWQRTSARKTLPVAQDAWKWRQPLCSSARSPRAALLNCAV